MRLTVLHTSDLHGGLDEAAAGRLAELAAQADLYFDCGDAVKSGNVAIPFRPDPVWERLARAGCRAGVPGNREFHVSSVGFRKKLYGCGHPELAANLRWNGRARRPLQPHASNTEFRLRPNDPLPSGMRIGRVGVFGLMVPMVTPRMKARSVSAFLNDPPVEAARACVEELRSGCDLLICLSHIGLKNDRRLATEVAGIDLILGGHSHDALDEPERVGDTWICHCGSHARFAGRYVWDGGLTNAHMIRLGARN
ncbi:MAG: metallophosphoesterase [Armatimonadetes bacterium]|nr:metallophosphoesterase [Armatimonadota bacterium]